MQVMEQIDVSMNCLPVAALQTSTPLLFLNPFEAPPVGVHTHKTNFPCWEAAFAHVSPEDESSDEDEDGVRDAISVDVDTAHDASVRDFTTLRTPPRAVRGHTTHGSPASRHPSASIHASQLTGAVTCPPAPLHDLNMSIDTLAQLRGQSFPLPPSPAAMWHLHSPSAQRSAAAIKQEEEECDSWWSRQHAQPCLLRTPEHIQARQAQDVVDLMSAASCCSPLDAAATLRSTQTPPRLPCSTSIGDSGSSEDKMARTPRSCVVEREGVGMPRPPAHPNYMTPSLQRSRVAGMYSQPRSAATVPDLYSASPVLSPFASLPQCFDTPQPAQQLGTGTPAASAAVRSTSQSVQFTPSQPPSVTHGRVSRHTDGIHGGVGDLSAIDALSPVSGLCSGAPASARVWTHGICAPTSSQRVHAKSRSRIHFADSAPDADTAAPAAAAAPQSAYQAMELSGFQSSLHSLSSVSATGIEASDMLHLSRSVSKNLSADMDRSAMDSATWNDEATSAGMRCMFADTMYSCGVPATAATDSLAPTSQRNTRALTLQPPRSAFLQALD
ncbi:hypothetical protein EON66_07905, partial [archaeon]